MTESIQERNKTSVTVNDLLTLAVHAHGGLARWNQLNRHQYTVDVLGSAPGLNHALDYHEVQGIMVPRKRRVYATTLKSKRSPRRF